MATTGEFISPLASAVTLTVSASPLARQTLTFIAQLGPAPPAGIAQQTGQVLFQDDGYPIGTVSLAPTSAVGSSAILTTAALAVGIHTITAVSSGDATWGSSFGRITVTITTPALFLTNAASPADAVVSPPTAFAPDEIVSAFNVQGLTGDMSGTLPLGTSLGGASVTLTDSAGTARPALLYGVFATTGQINFVMPSGTAAGGATVMVAPPSGASQALQIQIANASPGIFSANERGNGTFAGQIVIVHADGSQTVENSVISSPYGSGPLYSLPVAISFAVPTDQILLQLYGTGMRHASAVTATINGTNATVGHAGAQGGEPGTDQVNLQVPSSLAGAGTVNIVITADGQAANTVTTLIQ